MNRWLPLFVWMLWFVDESRGQEPWVRPPSAEQVAQTPGLVHQTFASAAMQTDVGYCVVLPPGYAQSTERYPVLYWLHGGGGSESSTLFTAPLWRELIATEQIDPVILVYPNGFRSGYMDHADGKTMNETMIIRELIPRIDQQFRTVRARHGRAAHGFSMGASGSLRFAIKYPELFCSAIAYGGGAIDLAKTTDPWLLDILERNLASDPDRIRAHNSYHFLELNAEILRQRDTQFFLICGDRDSWHQSAVDFQAALQAAQLVCPLRTVAEVGHNLRRLYAAEGRTAALLQAGYFRRASRSAGGPE